MHMVFCKTTCGQNWSLPGLNVSKPIGLFLVLSLMCSVTMSCYSPLWSPLDRSYGWGTREADGFTLAGGLGGRAGHLSPGVSAFWAVTCYHHSVPRPVLIVLPVTDGILVCTGFVPWAAESSWAYFGWCSDMLIVCFLCYLQAFPTNFVPESHTWKQCSRALGPDCSCSDSRFIHVNL